MQAFDKKKNKWFSVLFGWSSTKLVGASCTILKNEHPNLASAEIHAAMFELVDEMTRHGGFWIDKETVINTLLRFNPRLDKDTAESIIKVFVEVGLFVSKDETMGTRTLKSYSSPCLLQVESATSKRAIASRKNGKKHISKEEKEKQRLQNNAEESPQEQHFTDNEAKFSELDCEEEPFDLFASESKEKKPKMKTQKAIEEMEGSGLVWILNDGSKWELPKSILEEFKKNYPAIDVEQELRNCIGWNISVPKNRKTKSGILPHIRCWLSKNQNSARESNGIGNYRNYNRPNKFGVYDESSLTSSEGYE